MDSEDATPAEKPTRASLPGAPIGAASPAGAPQQALVEAATPGAKKSRLAPPASPPRDRNGINTDYMNKLQEALDTVHAHKVFETIKADNPLQITEHDVDETNFKATLSEI
jgi:hypothetical protein